MQTSKIDAELDRLLDGEHEMVQFLSSPENGLRAVLCIHDRSLGPALGGTRCRAYEGWSGALEDALALSRAMTRKAALAGLPAGGGKVVVIESEEMQVDPARRAEAFRSLGRAVDGLGGRLFTSGDLGTGELDLRAIAESTRFVTHPARDGTPDLARATADGVFLGASASLEALGIDQWRGLDIAIQGLGKVGLEIALLAVRAGAQVFASEKSSPRAGHAADMVPVTLLPADEIWDVSCDVFCPCAVGGVLSAETVERLRCRVIAGAANNPLADDRAAQRLHERGILYSPDFVVSAGALLRGCGPALAGFRAPADLGVINRTMRSIALDALSQNRSPEFIARERADEIWRTARVARRSG